MTGPRVKSPPSSGSSGGDVLRAVDRRLALLGDQISFAVLAHARHQGDAAHRTRTALDTLRAARAALAAAKEKEEEVP